MNEQVLRSALKKLKDQKENFGMMEEFDVDENFEVTKALEKQIPKKPTHDDGAWSICPCCGGRVCNDSEQAVNGEVSYCEQCGQALDWEEGGTSD